MKLSFSQASQPTPSAQLGNSLKAMSLSSQSMGNPSTQDKPPVPLFSEGGGPPVASQQLPLPPHSTGGLAPLEIPSQEFLGTQDFITPVDQFVLEYDPKDAKRSPARLSPDRAKRPRQGGAGGQGRVGRSSSRGASAGCGVGHVTAEHWAGRALWLTDMGFLL